MLSEIPERIALYHNMSRQHRRGTFFASMLETREFHSERLRTHRYTFLFSTLRLCAQ
jgi:hypothetical protein